MKLKNAKKALSVALAALMLALAMPFAMLTVAAEGEGSVKPTISSVTLSGWMNDGTLSQAFILGNNYDTEDIIDGDIVSCIETKAYTEGKTLQDCLKTSYFDENGKYGYLNHTHKNGTSVIRRAVFIYLCI